MHFMTRWQLQDAKARLSEVVKKATSEGPQEITVHGEPAVVVLSVEAFKKLKGEGEDCENLADFFMNSPLKGVDLEDVRDRSPARNIRLAGRKR